MKRILGILIVLFALSNAFQFLKYSINDDYRYDVQPWEDDSNEIRYKVYPEETIELYDLEKYQVRLLWFTILSLSGLSAFYVLYTVKSKAYSPLDDLNKENEIIKKQIEKRELLTKLENLEKK